MNSTAIVHLGIGIDTARYGHHVSVLDSEKRTASKPFGFAEDANGYQRLLGLFEKLSKKYPDVHFHIRVDVAGQYAENLLQWLHRQELSATISVGQPNRNKKYREVHYDKRKADPVESLACARFAVVERPKAAYWTPPEFSHLRDVVAAMEASSKHQTRLVNQLHNLLARIFPELALFVSNLSANWVLHLLAKYPTARKIAAARISSLVSIPHLDQEKACEIHAAAKISTASNGGDIAESMIKQKIQAIRCEQTHFADLEKLVKKAFKSIPNGPHKRIQTIKGIGTQTSAALVAKIVSIERFATASALIGYFGVFPEEQSVSGFDKDGSPKTQKVMRMSPKGNDLVRRLLFTAAQSAIKHNPPVKALFARLRAAGKDYKQALGHCMAKLLRQAFAVWTKDCDFDPEYETRQEKEVVVGHKNQAVKPQIQGVTTTDSNIPQPGNTNKLPPINFAELRQQISITQILERLDWTPPKATGNQWRGPCPIHQDKNEQGRSFAVNVEKNMYCCQSCGSQGNALDLWAAAQEKPILEASWQLINELNLEAPLLQN